MHCRKECKPVLFWRRTQQHPPRKAFKHESPLQRGNSRSGKLTRENNQGPQQILPQEGGPQNAADNSINWKRTPILGALVDKAETTDQRWSARRSSTPQAGGGEGHGKGRHLDRAQAAPGPRRSAVHPRTPSILETLLVLLGQLSPFPR